MTAETLILIGATLGSAALTTLIWFALGDWRRKEQPIVSEQPSQREVGTDRTPAPPVPSDLDPALNQMFYAGVTFAHGMNQQRREVRRNKQYVTRAAGQRCEQARTKVKREHRL